jgi:hypothetical protein
MTDDPDDIEQQCADALLRAASVFLECQRRVQPAAIPAIRAEMARSPEVRFEITCQAGALRSATIRCVLLDGVGGETMLIRALDLAPARGPLQ